MYQNPASRKGCIYQIQNQRRPRLAIVIHDISVNGVAWPTMHVSSFDRSAWPHRGLQIPRPRPRIGGRRRVQAPTPGRMPWPIFMQPFARHSGSESSEPEMAKTGPPISQYLWKRRPAPIALWELTHIQPVYQSTLNGPGGTTTHDGLRVKVEVSDGCPSTTGN